MWSLLIVFPSPVFHQYPGLSRCGEYLAVQQLVSEFAIEWVYVAILPRASLLNGQSLHLQTVQPDRQCPGSEFGPIVRADMLRHSPEHEELEQLADDILRGDTTIYRYRRTHPGIFVDYGR